MSGVYFDLDEAIPKGFLPATDEPVVIAYRAVPVDALEIVSAGVRHHDAGAAFVPWTPAAAHSGFFIEIGGGIEHNTGKVLGQLAGRARHVGDRPGRSEIMAKIDDPRHAVQL